MSNDRGMGVVAATFDTGAAINVVIVAAAAAAGGGGGGGDAGFGASTSNGVGARDRGGAWSDGALQLYRCGYGCCHSYSFFLSAAIDSSTVKEGGLSSGVSRRNGVVRVPSSVAYLHPRSVRSTIESTTTRV
eukprot:evm.model.NODE_28313_length_3400_cov_15.830882.1